MKNIELVNFLGLGNKNLKISKVNTEKYKGKNVKMIYLEQTNKKCRCPDCNQFTTFIHDRLKPSFIKKN